MIAKDYQEVYNCITEMQKILDSLGVQPATSFGNVTALAEAFAKATILETNSDRVQKLSIAQPEQAAAFASILGDIRAELSRVCAAPAAGNVPAHRLYMIAAEEVLHAIKARRARRQGYSGAYLTFPRD